MIVHCYIFTYLNLTTCVFIYKFITAQKMKFSINDFFSKCDQIRRFLQCISRSYFQKSQKKVNRDCVSFMRFFIANVLEKLAFCR